MKDNEAITTIESPGLVELAQAATTLHEDRNAFLKKLWTNLLGAIKIPGAVTHLEQTGHLPDSIEVPYRKVVVDIIEQEAWGSGPTTFAEFKEWKRQLAADYAQVVKEERENFEEAMGEGAAWIRNLTFEDIQ